MTARRAPAAAWLLVALLAPGGAAGVGGVEAGGSVRSVAAGLVPSTPPRRTVALTQTLARGTATARPHARLLIEGHAVVAFEAFEGAGFAGAAEGLSPAGGGLRYRAGALEWSPGRGDSSGSRAWVDRARARWRAGWGDVTAGRQAITFGTAYFWNPLDVFRPFDPRAIDRSYKPGVDAVRVDVPLGPFSGLSVVGAGGTPPGAAPGRVRPAWNGSALLARVRGAASGWDLAAQGGKVLGGWHLGAGASGEAGPIEVRLEGAHFLREGPPAPLPPFGVEARPDHAVAVAGIGRRFGGHLTVEAEYLYNGAGAPDRLLDGLARVASGDALQAGRHLAGALVATRLHPLVSLQLVSLASFGRTSVVLQPGLSVSLGDETELKLGALKPFGSRGAAVRGGRPDVRSEFGSQPAAAYGEVIAYF